MTAGRAIVAATLVSVAVITAADAPSWSVRPYLGLLAAMGGIAGLAEVSPELARAFSGLVVVAVIVTRGEAATRKLLGGLSG